MLAQNRLGKAALRPLVQSRNLFFLPTLASAATGFFLRDSIRLANSLEDNVNQRKSSNDVILEESEIKPYFSRPAKKYANHIPLYPYEKVAMFVTSAIGAFLHPEKNQYIVALGESTAIPPFLKRLRKQMLDDETGRQILKDRPNITSTSLDLDKLAALPENTFGRTYYEWLKREGCSPDTRVPVRFIDDEELAFVFQRYRQCHDFYHALAGLPISREGEIAVKFFEFLTLGIPFAGMGAVFAPLNIRKSQRDRLLTIYYPWAISSAANCKKHLINVYWENIMEKDVNELRDELGITVPPDMRELRRIAREKRRALQANPSPTP